MKEIMLSMFDFCLAWTPHPDVDDFVQIDIWHAHSLQENNNLAFEFSIGHRRY